MSPTADVAEMRDLCTEIADRMAASPREKDRVGAIASALGFGWNRALEFIRGKARRVDSWEKDHARRILDDLRRKERQQRELDHLSWLECEIARHRASGEELRGPHVDGLEHFLRLARDEAGAVAIPKAEAAD